MPGRVPLRPGGQRLEPLQFGPGLAGVRRDVEVGGVSAGVQSLLEGGLEDGVHLGVGRLDVGPGVAAVQRPVEAAPGRRVRPRAERPEPHHAVRIQNADRLVERVGRPPVNPRLGPCEQVHTWGLWAGVNKRCRPVSIQRENPALRR